MTLALQQNRKRKNPWVWGILGMGVAVPFIAAQTGIVREVHTQDLQLLPDDKEPSTAGAIILVGNGPQAQAEGTSSGDDGSFQPGEDVEPGATPGGAGDLENPSSYTPAYQVLIPPVVAIILAILFRSVVPALFIGVLVGGYMMIPDLGGDLARYQQMHSAVGGFRLAAEHYVVGAILDPGSTGDYGHAKIIVFTMAIGFMVGVIGRNGGSAGMVNLVAGQTESPRRGRLTAWLAGMLVFFDDYANTMIVGPTMRPIFDRLKIARAKLAYIVDSTAAPISSIFIGTWVGTEITYIDNGLESLRETGVPEFLSAGGDTISAMSIFWESIPYRFYAVLALIAVFFVALLGRDFGPMRKSESRALSGEDDQEGTDVHVVYDRKPAKPRWWLGVTPVFVLVAVTVGLLFQSGLAGLVSETNDPAWWQNSDLAWFDKLSEVLSRSDPYLSIFYGAILSAIVALLMTFAARACSIKDAADAGLDGMMRMASALVILVLAWALSGVAQDMKLGEVVSYYLRLYEFQIAWLPMAIFVAAAVVSFATGTAWGTMGILTPMAVSVSARLAADLPVAEAMPLFYSAVGAVLAGSVFGDHCSPISDTTVLSSMASGCRHEEHVWTQMPYAIVTALVAIGCGHVMCDVYGLSWYCGLGTGIIALFLILLIFGRRPMAVEGRMANSE